MTDAITVIVTPPPTQQREPARWLQHHPHVEALAEARVQQRRPPASARCFVACRTCCAVYPSPEYEPTLAIDGVRQRIRTHDGAAEYCGHECRALAPLATAVPESPAPWRGMLATGAFLVILACLGALLVSQPQPQQTAVDTETIDPAPYTVADETTKARRK